MTGELPAARSFSLLPSLSIVRRMLLRLLLRLLRLSELEQGRQEMAQWNALLMEQTMNTEPSQKRERETETEAANDSTTRPPKTNKGEKGGKGKGGQPKPPSDKSEKSAPSKDLKSVVRMLTTLVIRQQDQLQLSRQDSAYVLFMKTSAPLAILPQLFNLGQAWNAKKAKDPASPGLPLRVVLLGGLLQQLEQRIKQLDTDES